MKISLVDGAIQILCLTAIGHKVLLLGHNTPVTCAPGITKKSIQTVETLPADYAGLHSALLK